MVALPFTASLPLEPEETDARKPGLLVIRSAPMQRLLVLLRASATTSRSVLLVGPSGSGRNFLTHVLHAMSPRADKPLITLHCAALAESLLESELFGHEKGAFTGADKRRAGRFEQAHGGTLFLDEVGEIPASTQVKLLRVLQEKTFERVGGNDVIEVDVRLVAATNRDLAEDVRQGRFREDLYYRLDVIHLELPPLRERPGDVALLAEHFLGVCAERAGRSDLLGFSPEALALLEVYEWPGNVRQLQNVIFRAVTMTDATVIDVADLELASARQPGDADAPVASLTQAVEDFERDLLTRMYREFPSTRRLALRLKTSHSAIAARLRRYRINSN